MKNNLNIINRNNKVTLFQILGRNRSPKPHKSLSIKRNTKTIDVQLPNLYDNYLTEHQINLGYRNLKSIHLRDDFPPKSSIETPIRLKSIMQCGQMNIKIDQLLNRRNYAKSSILNKLH